mgnify:CR=1 FL=1
MVGNLKNSFIEKQSTSGTMNSFSNNKQNLTKLPSISSLLNDDEHEQNNNNNNNSTVENGDKMFTKSITTSTTPLSATTNTSLSMAKNNTSNDQTYPHSSSVPLPRMVSVSKMNISQQPPPQQNVSPYLATTMNTNNNSTNTIGNDIAMKKDLSQQQQPQSRVHFIQQSQLSPQFVQQQPIPQYRVINNNKYQLNMDISRNNSSNSNNGTNNSNSSNNNNNMPLAVPVPMHSTKNLSIPIINSNNNTNSDAYSTPFSPYSQSRTYSGQTRNTSGNQITPLSATTTIYRQNSRAGFTPMNTVFSKNQDMSAHVTPINRIQFASSAKPHSESFSSPQIQGNTPKSTTSRKHFRSLPVLYQQQRTNSHVINSTPDINSNNNSMNPSAGNIQQQHQTIINANNDPSYHNNMMFTQQYNQYPQHLHHEQQQQQQQLPSQTLYQYPQQYIQIPVQQDHHVSSPMFVQQTGNISGRTPSRLSFSNYNGFTINPQQQQPLISKTPPLVDTREKQTSLNSDLSPKRTTSNSSNLGDSHLYKNEMIKVEVETEIPIKRIPRPRNAFILFRQHYHRLIFQEQTEKLASERSNSDPTNEDSTNDNGENIVNSFKLNSSVSKTIGLKWKNLSPEERKHWSDLAEKEKADHQMKYPDYKYVPRRKKIIKK